jgi:hypothetical protein
MEHARDGHVVHVGLVAERQLGSLIAGGAGADPPAAVDLGERLAAPGRGHEPDRVDDLDVAGAAAEVAGEGLGDLLSRGVEVLGEQRLGLHHDAGRAEPALRRAGGDEARRPALALPGREALLGDDLLAGEPRCPLRAGHDRAALDHDRARAARALRRTAVLHGGHAAALAENLEETCALAHLHRDGPAVEGEVHFP